MSLTGAVPKAGARAMSYHLEATPLGVAAVARPVAEARPATTVIDVPGLYRTLMRMPWEISRLDRDVFWCSAFLVVIGALNALLLATLPKAISGRLQRDVVRRVDASVAAMLETTKVEMFAAASASAAAAVAAHEPIVFATRLEPKRMCACGSPIGARTRTGLCRRCAQVARMTRRELEAAPSPRALPSSSHDMGGLWEPVAQEMVARSRIGECRQYYTITVAPLEAEANSALN